MDKVSYIIGTQIGAQVAASLKAQGVDVTFEMLVQGIRDALTGKSLSSQRKSKVRS